MADYDYTKPGSYPRSGRDKVGGITFLGRTIDKMRAFVNGTHGEYASHRGLSNRVFTLFGVTAEEFEQIVRDNPTDEGVLNVWVGDVGANNAKPGTKDRGRGIQIYRWAYDGRHIGGSDELHELDDSGQLDKLLAKAT